MKALTACLGECGQHRHLAKGWCCDECKKRIEEKHGGEDRLRKKGFLG